MKEIIGLVAVRMDSTRLPGKAFRLLNGKPLIENLVDRLTATDLLDDFIICTTVSASDDRIEDFCKKKRVNCFRGDVKNVLGRFLGAMDTLPSEYVVRITGDNPLSDFVNMDLSFKYMKKNGGDYSRPVGLPLGTACEIIRSKSMREINERTLSHDLTEYMTWFFEMAPFVKSTLYNVEDKYQMTDLRLTVDYLSDLEFMQALFDHFSGRVPSLEEVVSYCRTLDEYPKVMDDQPLVQQIKPKIKFK